MTAKIYYSKAHQKMVCETKGVTMFAEGGIIINTCSYSMTDKLAEPSAWIQVERFKLDFENDCIILNEEGI